MTIKEAVEKFQTIHAVEWEIKRITPIIQGHREWALWGNVEHRESYNRLLAYKRTLKKAKAVIEYLNEQ